MRICHICVTDLSFLTEFILYYNLSAAFELGFQGIVLELSSSHLGMHKSVKDLSFLTKLFLTLQVAPITPWIFLLLLQQWFSAQYMPRHSKACNKGLFNNNGSSGSPTTQFRNRFWWGWCSVIFSNISVAFPTSPSFLISKSRAKCRLFNSE